MSDFTPEEKSARRAVLVVAVISSFLTPFMGSSVNIAMVKIQEEFEMDAVLLSWVATSYLLSAAVFLVPFGKLADIKGRRKIFCLGVLIFTVSSALCGAAGGPATLIFARIIQGWGSALIFATGIAILTSVFRPEERGKVIGITIAAVYIGLALGPVLGGVLTQQFGWRSIFYFTVPVGLVTLYLAAFRFDGEWADAAGEGFDLIGSVLYGLAVVAVMYGLPEMPKPWSFGLIALGLALGGLFIWRQLKAPYPVFNLELFTKSRTFAFSNLAAFINYAATFASTFILSLYLQHIKGMTPQQAGTIMIAQPVVMAIFSPYSGRLSDRVAPGKLASAGMACSALALLLFAFIGNDTGRPYIIGVLLLLGLGFALFSSPNTNAIMGAVEKRYYGIAAGAVSSMRLLGQMFSMGIATLVFSVLIGRAEISPEVYPAFLKSVKILFAIFAALCAIGVPASMARGDAPDPAGDATE